MLRKKNTESHNTFQIINQIKFRIKSINIDCLMINTHIRNS